MDRRSRRNRHVCTSLGSDPSERRTHVAAPAGSNDVKEGSQQQMAVEAEGQDAGISQSREGASSRRNHHNRGDTGTVHDYAYYQRKESYKQWC